MIEPCPFCGASGERDEIEVCIDEYNLTRMRCSVCKAEGPPAGFFTHPLTPSTFKKALYNWNLRAPKTRDLVCPGCGSRDIETKPNGDFHTLYTCRSCKGNANVLEPPPA